MTLTRTTLLSPRLLAMASSAAGGKCTKAMTGPARLQLMTMCCMMLCMHFRVVLSASRGNYFLATGSSGLSSDNSKGAMLRRSSLCAWEHDQCVPSYVQLYTSGSPPMQTFSARAYASTLAQNMHCSAVGGAQATCAAPCSWSDKLGCHMGHMDALRQTLACSGSEVQQMAACGFTHWSHTDWSGSPASPSSAKGLSSSAARRLLTAAMPGCGKPSSCAAVESAALVGDTTCAAGFFARMSSKEERAGWCIAVDQGDASAWGCCPGSVLFTRLAACGQLSASACSFSSHCALQAGVCAPATHTVAELAFGAEGAASRHGPAAELARKMLAMPHICAMLGIEECAAHGVVEVDVARVASYALVPTRSEHYNELHADPGICLLAAIQAVNDLEAVAEPGVVFNLLEELPHEDEDVVF